MVVLTLILGTVFRNMGMKFDDGKNFNIGSKFSDDNKYDTSHNDYAYVSEYAAMIIAQLRNTLGDLQPPTYDYWVNYQ